VNAVPIGKNLECILITDILSALRNSDAVISTRSLAESRLKFTAIGVQKRAWTGNRNEGRDNNAN
jgi:hypothetical protein